VRSTAVSLLGALLAATALTLAVATVIEWIDESRFRWSKVVGWLTIGVVFSAVVTVLAHFVGAIVRRRRRTFPLGWSLVVGSATALAIALIILGIAMWDRPFPMQARPFFGFIVYALACGLGAGWGGWYFGPWRFPDGGPKARRKRIEAFD